MQLFQRVAGESGAEGKHLVSDSFLVHVLDLSLLSGPQPILLLSPQRTDMLGLVLLRDDDSAL